MGSSEGTTCYCDAAIDNLMASILKFNVTGWLNEIMTDVISNVLETLSVTVFLGSLIVFGCLILVMPLDRPQMDKIIEYRSQQIEKKRKQQIVRQNICECEAASYMIRRTRSGCIYGLYLLPGYFTKAISDLCRYRIQELKMDAGSFSPNSNSAVATAGEENAISGLNQMEYYFLLLLIVLPVKLFFALWAWLGWELFKNN